MSKKDKSIGSPTNTVSFYKEQPDTMPVHIVSTTVKSAQPSPWIQSVLVTASEMCTISSTQLHCPNVSIVVPDTLSGQIAVLTYFPKWSRQWDCLCAKKCCGAATVSQTNRRNVSNIEETVHSYKRIVLRLHH